MCQYPHNNSIQPIAGQWSHCLDFLTFIFCLVTRTLGQWSELSSSPGQFCSRDSVCVSEWIAFCTCQSDKNIPGSQAFTAYYNSAWVTFHVQFPNDFQFLHWAELTQKATKMLCCCFIFIGTSSFSCRTKEFNRAITVFCPQFDLLFNLMKTLKIENCKRNGNAAAVSPQCQWDALHRLPAPA